MQIAELYPLQPDAKVGKKALPKPKAIEISTLPARTDTRFFSRNELIQIDPKMLGISEKLYGTFFLNNSSILSDTSVATRLHKAKNETGEIMQTGEILLTVEEAVSGILAILTESSTITTQSIHHHYFEAAIHRLGDFFYLELDRKNRKTITHLNRTKRGKLNQQRRALEQKESETLKPVQNFVSALKVLHTSFYTEMPAGTKTISLEFILDKEKAIEISRRSSYKTEQVLLSLSFAKPNTFEGEKGLALFGNFQVPLTLEMLKEKSFTVELLIPNTAALYPETEFVVTGELRTITQSQTEIPLAEFKTTLPAFDISRNRMKVKLSENGVENKRSSHSFAIFPFQVSRTQEVLNTLLKYQTGKPNEIELMYGEKLPKELSFNPDRSGTTYVSFAELQELNPAFTPANLLAVMCSEPVAKLDSIQVITNKLGLKGESGVFIKANTAIHDKTLYVVYKQPLGESLDEYTVRVQPLKFNFIPEQKTQNISSTVDELETGEFEKAIQTYEVNYLNQPSIPFSDFVGESKVTGEPLLTPSGETNGLFAVFSKGENTLDFTFNVAGEGTLLLTVKEGDVEVEKKFKIVVKDYEVSETTASKVNSEEIYDFSVWVYAL